MSAPDKPDPLFKVGQWVRFRAGWNYRRFKVREVEWDMGHFHRGAWRYSFWPKKLNFHVVEHALTAQWRPRS